MTTLDPNWQSDALNPALGFFEETLAVRGGYHRTDEGEHGEAILPPAAMFINPPRMLLTILMAQKRVMCTHAIPILPSEPLNDDLPC